MLAAYAPDPASRPVLVAATALALAAGCPQPDPEAPAVPPGWHTEGGRILDGAGRQHVLHGINLSNDVKQPPFESWATEEDYARLQGWGMDAVRLLTSWAAIMPTEGAIDEEYLARYDQRVDWAEQHGLLVIADMHQDVFGLGFGGNGAPAWACDQALYDAFVPTDPWYLAYFDPAVQECYDRFWQDEALQDRYIEAFVEVARRYADRDHVIGFDLYNEPSWGTTPADEWHRDLLQPFYVRLVAALAEASPGRIHFVEPATLVQFGLEPTLEPFDVPGASVVYAPHYYDRGVHDEHAWDGNADLIESIFDGYGQTADRIGAAPWFLGEYGGHVDSTDFDAYVRTILVLLEERHAGSAWWCYDPEDGGFSPIDADHEEKWVVDLLARVYPKVASGELLEWWFDDEAALFTMTLRNDLDLAPEVVLAFPADRHYPSGWEIECSDPEGTWSVQQRPEATELVVTFDPGCPDHEVVVRPAAR